VLCSIIIIFLKIYNPMALTTWLLIIGGLTFTAIVMDGLRRMFASHAALKIDIDESLCGLPQDEYPSELPNGGARVVAPVNVINTLASSKTEIDREWSADPVSVELSPAHLTVETTVAEAIVAEVIVAEAIEAEELVVEALAIEELAVEALMIEDLTVASIIVEDLAVEDFQTTDLLLEIAPKVLDASIDESLVVAPIENLSDADGVVFNHDTSGLHTSQEQDPLDDDLQKETFALDRTPVSLSAEEIVALTTNDAGGDLSLDSAVDTGAASLEFDPTRPVHELVETNSMVQSDLFAEQDLSVLASVKSHVAHELLDTSDDILFSDTGIEELYAEGPFAGEAEAYEQDQQDNSLSTRLAKVTSMTFGKKLLNRKRIAAQEAIELAVEEQKSKQVAGVEQVISILVTANDGQGFYGPQLQQLVEACGLVHGDMNIFHRFEDGLRLGKTQFSMANMMEPGTFDLNSMDQLHTPGVVFFLGLPTAQDSMQAFDYMLETAQCLASNLGGEVLDEQRSVMRPQTIEHCRQQVREFERRNMTRRAQL
jgi:cell division protein ZipA